MTPSQPLPMHSRLGARHALACIGFFARHRKEEQHWLSHIVVPILGLLFLVPGLLSVAGITGIPGLSFIVALTAPYSYAPWAMLAWMIVGVVVLFVMQSRNPDAIEAVAHIHLDEEA